MYAGQRQQKADISKMPNKVVLHKAGSGAGRSPDILQSCFSLRFDRSFTVLLVDGKVDSLRFWLNRFMCCTWQHILPTKKWMLFEAESSQGYEAQKES